MGGSSVLVQRISWLFALLVFIWGLCACSGSDFSGVAGSRKGKQTEKGEDEEPTDDADGEGGDDGKDDGKDDGSEDDENGSLGNFLDGGEKLGTDESGRTLQRFSLDEVKGDVDVAFIIDTSGSMDKELDYVETNLEAFIAKLAQDPRTAEFQLFVLAGRDDEQFHPPAALLNEPRFDYQDDPKSHKVDSTNALGVARDFLSGKITTPKLKLREDSLKHLIFVTDDNAETIKTGLNEKDFRAWVAGWRPDPNLRIHGIVCNQITKGCSERGTAYVNLANDPQFKGLIQELASTDWSPLLDALATEIQVSVGHTFKVSGKIKDADKVEVFVNKKALDPSEFTVDGDTVSIKDGLLQPGDDVVIAY